jgi:hypothetical protein
MLRWSGHEHGGAFDASAVDDDTPPIELPWANELWRFAGAAAAGSSDLAARRTALRALAGDDVVVDAAAIAANFEMMTRLADGTGARFTDAGNAANADLSATLGFDDVVSRR